MIYEIAGLRIKIENKHPFTNKFCEKYLSADQESDVAIVANVTEEEFFEEKKLSPGYSDGYIENICLYRSLCSKLPVLNRMLLHAAILEYDGKAYAFLGRSGTGKSTHTNLWLQYLPKTSIVNGDKPILEILPNNECLAYGTPWMGKERLGRNTVAPLKGFCFLEQAKENSIKKLSLSEASSRLFSQVLLPTEEENAVATLELLDRLLRNVPAYLLKCTISEESVKHSFETLTGKNYEESKMDKE